MENRAIATPVGWVERQQNPTGTIQNSKFKIQKLEVIASKLGFVPQPNQQLLLDNR